MINGIFSEYLQGIPPWCVLLSCSLSDLHKSSYSAENIQDQLSGAMAQNDLDRELIAEMNGNTLDSDLCVFIKIIFMQCSDFPIYYIIKI